MSDETALFYRDEKPPTLTDLLGQVAELNEALSGALREVQRHEKAPTPYTLEVDGHPLAIETGFSDAVTWSGIVGLKFPKSQIKVVTA